MIFFISNLIDDLTAEEITDMLSDVTQIEKLAIEQDSDTDYAELSSQQINKSKLAVVYFKDSAEWAIPFAQQIWKKIGGAAATTPIFMRHRFQNFKTTQLTKAYTLLPKPNIISLSLLYVKLQSLWS